MRRNSQSDRIEAGAGQVADRGVLCERNHESQWPRPKGLRQRKRVSFKDSLLLCGCEIHDMGDQRIEDRATLCSIDLRDGSIRSCIGAEAIDRFCGKGHEAALQQDLRSFQHIFRPGRTFQSGISHVWRACGIIALHFDFNSRLDLSIPVSGANLLIVL